MVMFMVRVMFINVMFMHGYVYGCVYGNVYGSVVTFSNIRYYDIFS